MPSEVPTLRRSIGLRSLIFYGVGTMVGGGFYALMGKIVGEAGALAPWALAASGLLALVNALAFAEFSSRFPVSAGEARYVEEALGRVWLSTATGIMVVMTGIVSAAALSTATAGFVGDLIPIDPTLGVVLIVIALCAVAAWGIGESMALIVLITVVEVGALLLVVVTNLDNMSFEGIGYQASSTGGVGLAGLFSAAFLGFYAFVGFEDMVNVAEEVKQPRRNLPIAIMASVGITTLLYVAVSVVAVSSSDLGRLSASDTPIAELLGNSNILGRTGIGIVSILAGINGALVQIIMASRVCYGLADRGRLPSALGRIHKRTQTPIIATAIVAIITLFLATALPLGQLAKATSAIILVVFALVNFSLWKLKGRTPDPSGQGPRVPRWLPLLGFVSCVAVLAGQAYLVFGSG